MTKYEEICATSNGAIQRWIEFREHCWQYHLNIVNGLIKHCEIPPDTITYLRSNELPGEQRRYQEPEDSGLYTLPGAVTFDKDDHFWHLGIGIALSPKRVFPKQWTGLVICVTEDSGKCVVKIGAQGKPRAIEFANLQECADLYDEMAAILKARFDDPRRITEQKQIGFGLIANPRQGEREGD